MNEKKHIFVVMDKYYNSLSFADYPPTELLDSNIYLDSIKNLSFQYRKKDNNELIAYIALDQDTPDTIVNDIGDNINGCRILGVYVKPINKGNFNVTDSTLIMAILDEAEFNIMGWVNQQNGNFQFDYLWCYLSEITLQDFIERISNVKIEKGIAYSMIKRNE